MLHRDEELVYICLIRVNSKGLFVFRLHEHSPLAIVILQHENLIEVNGSRTLDSIGNIELGDVFKFPLVESGNAYFLTIEVTVIRTEP